MSTPNCPEKTQHRGTETRRRNIQEEDLNTEITEITEKEKTETGLGEDSEESEEITANHHSFSS
jgi:hypothetical protein